MKAARVRLTVSTPVSTQARKIRDGNMKNPSKNAPGRRVGGMLKMSQDGSEFDAKPVIRKNLSSGKDGAKYPAVIGDPKDDYPDSDSWPLPPFSVSRILIFDARPRLWPY